jgi:hypothetical protein
MTKPLRKVESRIKDKDAVLSNWLKLNELIMELDEGEIAELFEHERNNKARLRIMLRLHNRFSKLRGQREQREIGKDAKA